MYMIYEAWSIPLPQDYRKHYSNARVQLAQKTWLGCTLLPPVFLYSLSLLVMVSWRSKYEESRRLLGRNGNIPPIVDVQIE